MAQNFQITQVATNGTVVVMHPESNADLILPGSTYKVPTIANVTDWTNKSTEVANARKGETNLKAKIDKIDVALTASELLKTIKTVDGANSGLDADFVDGCGINDNAVTSSNLWTASQIQSKINEKVNTTDVVSSATANKILRLNSSGNLPASVTGNAGTATALASSLSLNFIGDVTGAASFTGKEGTVSVNLEVKDNSHTHSTLGPIAVNDSKQDSLSLWTALKIGQELTKAKEEASALVDNVVGLKNGEISIGAIKIRYGSISIKGKTTVDIDFGTPFNSILFNGHSCETSDVNIVATVAPNSTTTSGMQINLNDTAPDGKIVWFAVGL